MTRILVVEDEASIRDGLVSLFSGQGFDVTSAANGKRQRLLHFRGSLDFDVVVLDLMMPSPNGFEVLASLRAKDDRTPVLVLTALGAEDDVVRGLEAGADDYMTKPFGVKELLARVRGLMRRTKSDAAPASTIALGDATLDLGRLSLERAGKKIGVTAREADLLRYLAERRGQTIARDELLVAVWGYRDGSIQTRTVDVHIKQLRTKARDTRRARLDLDDSQPRLRVRCVTYKNLTCARTQTRAC